MAPGGVATAARSLPSTATASAARGPGPAGCDDERAQRGKPAYGPRDVWTPLPSRTAVTLHGRCQSGHTLVRQRARQTAQEQRGLAQVPEPPAGFAERGAQTARCFLRSVAVWKLGDPGGASGARSAAPRAAPPTRQPPAGRSPGDPPRRQSSRRAAASSRADRRRARGRAGRARRGAAPATRRPQRHGGR